MLFLLATCGESEEKIAPSDVPAAVMNAVKERFPDANVSGAAREREGGKTIYEVTLNAGAQKIDVSVTPDGTISLIERTISADALPPAVTQAVQAKYPGATYRIVETVATVERGTAALAYFEVLLETRDNRFWELRLAPDGKVLEAEKKSRADIETEVGVTQS